ncbi:MULTISPECIES: hypothetical protein [unclassified Agromyces]|uniref:hypothetical protein n=1 Tax=unclassified Agromyces TaxID=2639701 RepID=UPI0030141E75
MTMHHGTETRPVVEVIPLTPTTWRVCDSRAEDGESSRIVGYITTAQDGFEMLWMRPRPGVTYRYDSFADAVDATATRLRLLGR